MRYLTAAIVLAVSLCGCEALDLTGTRAVVDALAADVATAQAAHDAYLADIAALETQIAALPDGDAKDRAEQIHAGYVEGLEAVSAQLAVIVPAMEQLQVRLEASDDPLDAASGTIETVAPLFGPWGSLIGGFAVAALGLAKAARNKSAAVQLAKSIDPYVKLTADQAKAVSAQQGAHVKALVDEAQGKRESLLPF